MAKHRAEKQQAPKVVDNGDGTITVTQTISHTFSTRRPDLSDPEVRVAIKRGELTYEGRPACRDAFCNDVLNHERFGKSGHSWDGNPE